MRELYHAGPEFFYSTDPLNPRQTIPGGIGLGVSFSAEDLLRSIFWKSERAKKRNRKHANAWKSYMQN
jgi:hypothetical protein